MTAEVVVVGGGISGLTAAYRLARLPGVHVTLLEGSDSVGGKLRLGEVAGVKVDFGAESMLNRRPEAVALSHEIGLGPDLVHPETTSANLWNRNQMVPLPRTLMGVPGDVRALEGVLSQKGMARALLEQVTPASVLAGDVSIGNLIEERFGREVVDRLVEPLLGGVYAGHARELSARACVPQVVALADQHRSLTTAAAQALGNAPGDIPVFAGLRGGMGRLPQALTRALGQQSALIRTRAMVRDLALRPGGGWNLVVGSAHDAEILQADAVVLATPANASARLLSDVAPRAALDLARIEHASMAIITMAFREDDFPAVVGSGFLVPPVDGHVIKAATYSFNKWGWVREAGAGLSIMRASVGRHREESALQATDQELIEVAVSELGEAIGLKARPVDARVQRWGGGLPQYAVGHLDRIDSVRREVAALPGLAVCGAAHEGLGIPACIASADRAVAQILPLVTMGS